MSSYDEHLINMAGGDGEPDIDAIQARTDAATEGPYVLARYDHGGGRMFAQTASGERGVLVADTFRVGDREFHAEARADVLSLIALVREQQAVIVKLSDWAGRPPGRNTMSENTESVELHINALLTEVGVNMGDHAQDVTKAVVVDQDMTVRELCEQHLSKSVYVGFKEPSRTEADGSKSLTIRLAVNA